MSGNDGAGLVGRITGWIVWRTGRRSLRRQLTSLLQPLLLLQLTDGVVQRFQQPRNLATAEEYTCADS